MRYAIIQSGGKQYKAIEGQTIEVDRLSLEIGKKLTLDDILLVSDGEHVMVGAPTVKDAKVSATVVEQVKGPKVTIFKYRPRKRYRVKRGHRQLYTRLMIDNVEAKGVPKAAPAEKKAEAPKTEAKAEAKKETTKAKAAPKKQAAAKPKASAAKKPAPKKAPSTRRKLSGFEDLAANLVELLEGAGISTVSQALKALEDGGQAILDISGIGPKGLEDLKKVLKKEGYSLPK